VTEGNEYSRGAKRSGGISLRDLSKCGGNARFEEIHSKKHFFATLRALRAPTGSL